MVRCKFELPRQKLSQSLSISSPVMHVRVLSTSCNGDIRMSKCCHTSFASAVVIKHFTNLPISHTTKDAAAKSKKANVAPLSKKDERFHEPSITRYRDPSLRWHLVGVTSPVSMYVLPGWSVYVNASSTSFFVVCRGRGWSLCQDINLVPGTVFFGDRSDRGGQASRSDSCGAVIVGGN
mmetsp:Transcript_91337/g.293345  ORF Transcript_91337/g.293345 Transcript_91337/m.293345 type:complete len:179 (+) Transcript_91337:305-841(+)